MYTTPLKIVYCRMSIALPHKSNDVEIVYRSDFFSEVIEPPSWIFRNRDRVIVLARINS